MTEYFCAKNLTCGFVQVLESFFKSWLLRGWNSLNGHFFKKSAPSHDSELQTVSETASNVCFVFIRHSSARHSLALPKARFQELGIFSKRIVKLSFSFIDMIRQKKIGEY